jgi:hypothetical protein
MNDGSHASAFRFFRCRILSSAEPGIVNFRQLLSGNYLIFLRIKTTKRGAEIAFTRVTGF